MAIQAKSGLIMQGLDESISAFAVLDKKIRAEAIDLQREYAKQVQSLAKSRIGIGGYRLKKTRSMIARNRTRRGATVELNAARYPWAYAAEFGERWANIPIYRGKSRRGSTRFKKQQSFRRKTAAKLKQPTSSDMLKNKGGYLIQPAIRKLGPKYIKLAGERVTKLVEREMRRKGVKR